MAFDVPPSSLLVKGKLWRPPAWCEDLFRCPEHGCDYERTQNYWCCPATLSCKAIPEGLLLARLRRRARTLGKHRPSPENILVKARRVSRWLWGGRGREAWRERR